MEMITGNTFFAHGHTVPSQLIKGYEAFLFVSPRFVPGLEMPDYTPCMEETVNLLWVVPITREEYRFAMKHDIDETLKHVRGDIARIHIFDGVPKFADVE